MFASSIRMRLALWHTLAVAMLLGAFAAGTWAFLGVTTRARADQSLANTTAAFLAVWRTERAERQSTAARAAAEAAAEFRYQDRRVLVFDAAGRLVVLSDSAPLAPALTARALASASTGPLATLMRRAVPGQASSATLGGGDDEENPIRARAARVSVAGASFTVVTLESLAAEVEALDAFAEALRIALPLVLVLAGLGGYLLARASLAPVMAMARHAERTSASTLHQRLPVANPRDELGRLAAVLNGLLGRLERAFAHQRQAAEQQRQFMADASHELRTPVAALCSVADVALARRDRDPAELVEAMEVVRGEGRRLGRVVDDLFLLARADAGQLPVRAEPLFLEEVIQDCTRAARAMAARRRITLDVPPADESPFVGDAHLLRRLVMIFLDNAIKYTPPLGQVRLLLRRTTVPSDVGPGGSAAGSLALVTDAGAAVALHGAGGTYEIVVEDTGPGVPPAMREQIFERFVRGDVARARPPGHDARWDGAPEHGGAPPPGSVGAAGAAHAEPAGGAGLGLAIAQWIAAAHSGVVRLDATGPAGSRFVVTLRDQGAARFEPGTGPSSQRAADSSG